jgi:hypothetical protein
MGGDEVETSKLLAIRDCGNWLSEVNKVSMNNRRTG